MGGHGDACEAAAQTAEGSAGRPCDDAEFAPTPASSMSKANPAGSEGSVFWNCWMKRERASRAWRG